MAGISFFHSCRSRRSLVIRRVCVCPSSPCPVVLCASRRSSAVSALRFGAAECSLLACGRRPSRRCPHPPVTTPVASERSTRRSNTPRQVRVRRRLAVLVGCLRASLAQNSNWLLPPPSLARRLLSRDVGRAQVRHAPACASREQHTCARVDQSARHTREREESTATKRGARVGRRRASRPPRHEA